MCLSFIKWLQILKNTNDNYIDTVPDIFHIWGGGAGALWDTAPAALMKYVTDGISGCWYLKLFIHRRILQFSNLNTPVEGRIVIIKS